MTSKSKRNENAKKIAKQVGSGFKDIVRRGNQRLLVVKSRKGKIIFQSSLTIAAAALIILLMLPGTILIFGLMVFIGIITKVKIEILRVLNENDQMIEIETGDES